MWPPTSRSCWGARNLVDHLSTPRSDPTARCLSLFCIKANWNAPWIRPACSKVWTVDVTRCALLIQWDQHRRTWPNLRVSSFWNFTGKPSLEESCEETIDWNRLLSPSKKKVQAPFLSTTGSFSRLACRKSTRIKCAKDLSEPWAASHTNSHLTHARKTIQETFRIARNDYCS